MVLESSPLVLVQVYLTPMEAAAHSQVHHTHLLQCQVLQALIVMRNQFGTLNRINGSLWPLEVAHTQELLLLLHNMFTFKDQTLL